jgi:hypothetical protein
VHTHWYWVSCFMFPIRWGHLFSFNPLVLFSVDSKWSYSLLLLICLLAYCAMAKVTQLEVTQWTSNVFLWTSHNMFLTTLCLFKILLRDTFSNNMPETNVIMGYAKLVPQGLWQTEIYWMGGNFLCNNANWNWKFEELAVNNTNWDLSNRNLPLNRSVQILHN